MGWTGPEGVHCRAGRGKKTRGCGSKTEKLFCNRVNARGSVMIPVRGAMGRLKVVNEEGFSMINHEGQIGTLFFNLKMYGFSIRGKDQNCQIGNSYVVSKLCGSITKSN